jgi:mannose-6-phosphate isomerase
MQRVHGAIQNYAWGDQRAIPDLVGFEPDGRPYAELWFGTHTAAPSTVDDGTSLESVTGPLPYLLKVLAAGAPLSLQVHPSTEQAEEGFARETAAGIALTSPIRNYRDRKHKPELMYALTPFEAMCGIAPLEQTDALLASLGTPAASMRSILDHGGVDGVIGLLLHDRPPLDPLIAAASASTDPRCRWLVRLGEIHPGDSSAAIVLLLNHLELQPGQAIFLGAGNIHAYLGGTGIEVMAASDNVLRCGLTDKHVDVEEVLRVLDDTPLIDPLVTAATLSDGGVSYPVPVDEFRITRYDIAGTTSWVADGPELVFCVAGSTPYLPKGQCALAIDGERVELSGKATVFRVGGR